MNQNEEERRFKRDLAISEYGWFLSALVTELAILSLTHYSMLILVLLIVAMASFAFSRLTAHYRRYFDLHYKE